MAERGIIMTGESVGAILAGRKAQTRRLVKPQPYIDRMGNFCAADRKGKVWNWGQNIDGSPCLRNFIPTLPFRVGGTLWVRETWQLHSRATDVCTVVYRASEGGAWSGMHEQFPDNLAAGMQPKPFQSGWRSPIHMPRWASRLTLTVTDVRVQRLQDITEADARAEGVDHMVNGGTNDRTAYCRLWNTIHGRDAWDHNPWVAAITFDVHVANIDTLASMEAAHAA